MSAPAATAKADRALSCCTGLLEVFSLGSRSSRKQCAPPNDEPPATHPIMKTITAQSNSMEDASLSDPTTPHPRFADEELSSKVSDGSLKDKRDMHYRAMGTALAEVRPVLSVEAGLGQTRFADDVVSPKKTASDLEAQRYMHYAAMGAALHEERENVHPQFEELATSLKPTSADMKAKRDAHYSAMGSVLHAVDDAGEGHARFAEDVVSPRRAVLEVQRDMHYAGMGAALREERENVHLGFEEGVTGPKPTDADLKAKRDAHYGGMGSALHRWDDASEVHARFPDDLLSPKITDSGLRARRDLQSGSEQQAHYNAMRQSLCEALSTHPQFAEDVTSPAGAGPDWGAKRDFHYASMGRVLSAAGKMLSDVSPCVDGEPQVDDKFAQDVLASAESAWRQREKRHAQYSANGKELIGCELLRACFEFADHPKMTKESLGYELLQACFQFADQLQFDEDTTSPAETEEDSSTETNENCASMGNILVEVVPSAFADEEPRFAEHMDAVKRSGALVEGQRRRPSFDETAASTRSSPFFVGRRDSHDEAEGKVLAVSDLRVEVERHGHPSFELGTVPTKSGPFFIGQRDEHDSAVGQALDEPHLDTVLERQISFEEPLSPKKSGPFFIGQRDLHDAEVGKVMSPNLGPKLDPKTSLDGMLSPSEPAAWTLDISEISS